MLTKLCTRVWLAVQKILSHLDAELLAALYPLLAHDYPDLAPALIPRRVLKLVLSRGILADAWDNLSDCTVSLKTFEQVLKQHPRLLQSLLRDKLRNTKNEFPASDKKVSVLPLLHDDDDFSIASASFHPTRPIVAVIYKKTFYQMIVHAFGGVEREKRGSILYQLMANPPDGNCSVGATFRHHKQTPVKASWSPTGEYLLVLSKETKHDWAIQLFRWNDVDKDLRRVLTHKLPPYSGRSLEKTFISCWRAPSSFYTITQNVCHPSYPEFWRLDLNLEREEVHIQTKVLKEGFPKLAKTSTVAGLWLLKENESCMFVWAERCNDPRHPQHSVVRYRRAEEHEEGADTMGFILNSALVIGGEVDCADEGSVLLLIAQPFNQLEPIKIKSADDDDDDKYELNWSAINEEGLCTKRSLKCGRNYEIDDDADEEDRYWLTDYKAKYVLYIVRVKAEQPEVPVTVNVLKKFSYVDERGLIQKNLFPASKIIDQTETDLMIDLWPNLSLTVVASKLLPFSYVVRDMPRRFWHPSQQVYISRVLIHESAKAFETFYEYEEDDSDDYNTTGLLSAAESVVRKCMFVVLKGNRKNNVYEAELAWENCRPIESPKCKKARNQQPCRTCVSLQKRRLAMEWSNPLSSKVSKAT